MTSLQQRKLTVSSLVTTLFNLRWIILFAAILKWMSFYAWVVYDWFGLDFSLALWDSAVTNILLIACSLVAANIHFHYVPRWGKFWFSLGLSFFVALLCLWISHEALTSMAEGNEDYIRFLHKALPVKGSLNFFVIAGASIASLFYFQMQEQEAIARREADTVAMVREAELQKLQQQLQPHFLFNCLNSINAMIILKPDEARNMVQQLSDFLRTTLKRADEHWITLSEEWNYVQLYLAIEKVRFGHRLELKTTFEEDAMQWMMPTLLLQPVIENAIKFGLYGTTENVTIELEAGIVDRVLQIRATNPFDPDMQPPKGSGFGLGGLKRRLYLLFARNDLLQTQVLDSKFTVTLKLPPRS